MGKATRRGSRTLGVQAKNGTFLRVSSPPADGVGGLQTSFGVNCGPGFRWVPGHCEPVGGDAIDQSSGGNQGITACSGSCSNPDGTIQEASWSCAEGTSCFLNCDPDGINHTYSCS